MGDGMKIIIVDTNIIFSAILNAQSNIGEILFNNNEQFEFYTSDYLREEIERHLKKIIALSKMLRRTSSRNHLSDL
jgi:predicted nucleic acid-binding protein